MLVAYSMYDTENIRAPSSCPFQGVFLLVTNQEQRWKCQEGTQGPPGGSSTHVWLLQEVGYFQGMNKVAAILLMFLN